MFNPESSILLLDKYSDRLRNNQQSIQDRRKDAGLIYGVSTLDRFEMLCEIHYPPWQALGNDHFFSIVSHFGNHTEILYPNHMFNMFDAQHDIRLRDCVKTHPRAIGQITLLLRLLHKRIPPRHWHQILSVRVVVYHVEPRAPALCLLDFSPSIHSILHRSI